MTEFTSYQRRMWYWLTYCSVCRFYVDENQNGEYVIKRAGVFRLFIYYGLWFNTLFKLGYLILTYRGYLMEVHFMDQMSIWDWFLCISQVFQETNMWYRKYPLYEVLYANWKIQEDVFRKLGSPAHVQAKIMRNDKTLVIMHFIIISVGCSALVFQLRAAPKYALNTYAVVPYEHWILEVFFAAHEVIFIFHIWSHQASSIVLCEVFGVSYTHLIREMTLTLEKLINRGKMIPKAETQGVSRKSSPATYEVGSGHGQRKTDERQRRKHAENSSLIESKMCQRYLDPRVKVGEYDITTLLADYKKMMLSTTAFNSWAGKLQGGTMGSNYGQFVSDVFMMIQLLKEPGTEFMDVFFFMEDACAGMVMLFTMLILISRLYPASEEFLQLFKTYVSHDVPQRKYLLKYQRTLRVIAVKLGGYSTKSITVPKGFNALMNWYIAAAMWQRPADRMT